MEWRKLVVLLPTAFLAALGMGWLWGTVRIGILAHPETNWPLELLKLLLPPVLAGLTILLGAWVAYRYANKGRKEDILYKERFKGFEEVAAYAFSLRDLASDLMLYLKVTVSEDKPLEFYKYIKNNRARVNKLYEDKPNRKNSILLSENAIKAFDDLIDAHDALFYLFAGVYFDGKEYIDGYNIEEIKRDTKNTRETLQELHQQAKTVIELAFRDIDLRARR